MEAILIAELKRRQDMEGLSQNEFAAKLGMAKSALSKIYSGQRGIGTDVLQRILAVYPDLATVIFPTNTVDLESGGGCATDISPPAGGSTDD